jgi:hypothetical protein
MEELFAMSISNQTDTSELGGNWIKQPAAIATIGLIIGVLTKVLFHHHLPGISFALWSLVCGVGLAFAARIEGVQPARKELILGVGAVVFAAFFAIRQEPLAIFLNMLFTLFLFGIWIRTFRWGRLEDLNWLDYLICLILVPIEMLFRPWGVASRARKRLVSDEKARQPALAVVRGVVLALPILIVFTALLASADLVFGDAVEQLVEWLDWPLIVSWLQSLFIISVTGMVALGAIVTALQPADDRKVVSEGRTIPQFMGSIESGVLLGAVNALFLLFTMIQFRYLFGGEANISAAGYTYSEYARRGFGELVAVAFLSLGVIWLLGLVVRRDSRNENRVFNALGGLMIGLLFVILASAFKRLLLYEQAYGFTSLRLYTHVAIVWMALLFSGFLVILIRKRLEYFPFLTLLTAIGFSMTLNVMNVEAVIIRQNLNRAETSGELDVEYLSWLSSDSIPALVDGVQTADFEQQEQVWAVLACHQYILEARIEGRSWQSFHLSDWLAIRALDRVQDTLDDYPVEDDGWIYSVEGEDGLIPCWLR